MAEIETGRDIFSPDMYDITPPMIKAFDTDKFRKYMVSTSEGEVPSDDFTVYNATVIFLKNLFYPDPEFQETWMIYYTLREQFRVPLDLDLPIQFRLPTNGDDPRFIEFKDSVTPQEKEVYISNIKKLGLQRFFELREIESKAEKFKHSIETTGLQSYLLTVSHKPACMQGGFRVFHNAIGFLEDIINYDSKKRCDIRGYDVKSEGYSLRPSPRGHYNSDKIIFEQLAENDTRFITIVPETDKEKDRIEQTIELLGLEKIISVSEVEE